MFLRLFFDKSFQGSRIVHIFEDVFCINFLKTLFMIIIASALIFIGYSPMVFANISSKAYVDRIVLSSGFEEKSNKTLVINSSSTDNQYPSAKAVYTHISDISNPHAVTKTQVGLGNVQNIDQTNASNLTSGTVSFPLLPTGAVANTVATGDDARFMAVPTSQPTGTPPAGWAWFWISP